MRDLERAVSKVGVDTWVGALELARRLDAGGTFATGLRLIPPGRLLAKQIGAGEGTTADATLRLSRVPMAEGFQELAEAPGLRRKLALLIRELFPNRAFMRWWTPLARRGWPGLFLAYCWRVLWLAYRAVPGYLAWRKATRRR